MSFSPEQNSASEHNNEPISAARALGLYDASQCQALDVSAGNALVEADPDADSLTLMQRAAEAAFVQLLRHFPDTRSLSVWCGKGHNGGDGLLLAGVACSFGLSVHCALLHPRSELSGDCARAADRALAQGVVLEECADPNTCTVVADVWVDALLGTGIRAAPRPAYAAVIALLNRQAAPVLSLDIPSGVDATTGATPGIAVEALLTVTFIVHKVGLFTGAGCGHSGRVELATLGVSDQLLPSPAASQLHWTPTVLPPLPHAAYKHSRGHVLVLGGDHDMPGAVLLAATAALRVGAGLVSVGSRPEHTAVVVARAPEVMLFDGAAAALEDKLAQADLVVLGPGLGRRAWGAELYARAEASQRPVLLDADGLFWLAEAGAWQGGQLFLTPHPGEAARLLGVDVAAVEADRLAAAAELRARFGAEALVLKGPGSVVAADATPAVCAHGNPGMATAGMGDVLAGVASGLLAPLSRADAQHGAHWAQVFAQAVALHSAAADRAVERVGRRSLLASDVVDTLPSLLCEVL